MNRKFWQKEKTPEEILNDMVTAEQIRCMNVIKKNAEEGKPESENLILQKELSYYANMQTEKEKRETEKSNRRSKFEKGASTISPFVVMGCAIWQTKKDANGEITTRTQGGRIIARITEGAANKINDIKNFIKK